MPSLFGVYSTKVQCVRKHSPWAAGWLPTAASYEPPPKNGEAHNMAKWECTVCGHIHEGDEPPDECPVCGADKEDFERIED